MSILPFFTILLLSLKPIRGADLNVGTTLFTKADRCKECWSSESLALLTSRMILEDLLPSTTILVIDSNEFVTDLVEYFRLILEIVRQETHGKTKHITLMALTDLLGGYLYHAVLPIAKYAYYAGLIDYDSMATLLGLFDELKWFLRTNGQGWAKPLPQNLENFEIQRIPMQPCNDKDACENLMVVEGDSDGHEGQSRCDVTIPLPFFDSLTRPSAIALPTKACPLHNVEANSSSYLVMKFFVSAYKCLQSKNAKTQNMEKFQNDFCAWIEDQIMPRLEDERFYTAFGGVLRVRNTLKRLGVTQNNLDKEIDEFQHEADAMIENKEIETGARPMSRSAMILTAVLITIFVWFILGTLFICYKMRHSKQKEDESPCLEGGGKTTTCSSLISSKYFYPERPKSKDNKGTAESESTSDLDIASYHRRPRHEITIKTCHCHDDDDDDSEASAGAVDSGHTDDRLASITEMSERTSSESKKETADKTKYYSFSPPGTSTPASDSTEQQSKNMSVLNQSGEEQVECPLCMEPLEVDDLNFFPCTCGYQICRFCWHRIRTDENGLCPACRKAYSEDPADFTPLSQEQVAKLKAEKRQRDQQRKAKLSESRKHLASVRVVQRNLVFVVGLPMRLADPEVLKRHEYFGKFGKIHKVVINQSTSYAGSQGPSASAYVTYMKSDDALRAIQSVNNVTIDGRLIKSSLGTTKYCSHFMKNQPCPKPDCMYLHDFGDPEASFTKEQMHAGKHQEYEKKLHEALLQRTTNNNQNMTSHNNNNNNNNNTEQAKAKSKETTPPSNGTNKENWPQLSAEKDGKEKKAEKTDSKDKVKGKSKSAKEKKEKKTSESSSQSSTKTDKLDSKDKVVKDGGECMDKLSILDDNSSFFSHNSFQKIVPERQEDDESPTQPPILTDSLPDINTTEDWAAAFGFNKLESLQGCGEASPSTIDSYFRNSTDDFRNLIEVSKLQDNIRDVLTSRNNGFVKPPQQQQQQQESYFGKESGLDQHMSKFFMDFHQKNGQKDGGYGSAPVNGMNGFSSHLNNYFMNPDRLLLLQQKKLEEHLMNLSLKQQNYGPTISHSNGHYMNGDVGQNGYGYHGPLFQNQPPQMTKTRTHSEDELDFDPFQETQKALAELIANEQSYKTHNNGEFQTF
ncbi:hypothetical protein BDFB_002531 [Asbolus verrucosus]|uniref:CCR4-NOT transcription complex subunit 4 n=1 Tax=Asbolus verrucosus TaxID=1661398 RepID=A0A482VVB1_ASBVE|nr:hypothetical protein BDFB_002531 [Asbolus verrucosus]